MASEIYYSWDDAATLYFLVYRPADTYIWDVGDSAFEAVGAWNNTRVGECDIAMTAAGDMHFGDFPTGITTYGKYYIQIRLQSGGSPDITDLVIAQGEILWDGSKIITISELYESNTNIESGVDELAVKNDVIYNEFETGT